MFLFNKKDNDIRFIPEISAKMFLLESKKKVKMEKCTWLKIKSGLSCPIKK